MREIKIVNCNESYHIPYFKSFQASAETHTIIYSSRSIEDVDASTIKLLNDYYAFFVMVNRGAQWTQIYKIWQKWKKYTLSNMSHIKWATLYLLPLYLKPITYIALYFLMYWTYVCETQIYKRSIITPL